MTALPQRRAAVAWEADPETFRFRSVGPGAERLLGYPVAEWLRPGFWVDRLHPEDRERAVTACRDATTSRSGHVLEYRLVASDGSPVWVEDNVEVVCEDDRVVLLRGVLVDATPHRCEEALTGFLVRHSSDVLTLLAPDGTIEYDSPAIERVLGYPPGALVGSRAFDLVHPDDVDKALTELERTLLVRDYSEPAEVRLRHRDGSYRYVEAIACLLPTGSVLVSSRDITLQRRTGEAQKMEALGRLAGAIAHDFNNILFVAKAHAERVRTGAEPDVAGAMAEVVDAADRGAALTRQLLAFGRTEPASDESCDAGETARDLAAMLAQILGERVTLVVHAEPGVPPAAIGRGQLEQVLLNLVLNARDALPDGGRIEVEVAEADGRVRIRVRDDGTGMDEATLARVFEPYFTTKPEGGGTGIGLSTVFAIVGRHGGEIHVDSELGVGSTFCIQLPAALPRRHSVLVVDDDEPVRTLLAHALTEAGYTAIAASGLRDALRLAADEGPFDVLVTDIILGDGRGVDLAAALRGESPGLRVLVTSGYGMLPGADVNGADAVLTKPFSLDALRALVARLAPR